MQLGLEMEWKLCCCHILVQRCAYDVQKMHGMCPNENVKVQHSRVFAVTMQVEPVTDARKLDHQRCFHRNDAWQLYMGLNFRPIWA